MWFVVPFGRQIHRPFNTVDEERAFLLFSAGSENSDWIYTKFYENKIAYGKIFLSLHQIS